MNRMQEKFDRSQFHELVWSKQISDIAKEYELSESKLKDIAREYDIPMPDRNYWLAKSRGETPESKPLPRRRFAGGQYIYLKGSPRHYYYWGSVTKEELYAPLPPKPEFEYEIEEVRPEVLAEVKEKLAPISLLQSHSRIKKLLDDDKRRKSESKRGGVRLYWGPTEWFGTHGQKRRLGIMNSVFKTIERMQHTIQEIDDHGNNIVLLIHGQKIKLEIVEMQHRGGPIPFLQDEPELTKVKISLNGSDGTYGCFKEWRDEPKKRLEDRLIDIITDIILTSEIGYRSYKTRQWEEDIRAIKHARQEYEKKRIEDENKRIERLISQAEYLQKADQIRSYVQKILESKPENTEQFNLDKWSSWALKTADLIDPIKSESFKEIILEKE